MSDVKFSKIKINSGKLPQENDSYENFWKKKLINKKLKWIYSLSDDFKWIAQLFHISENRRQSSSGTIKLTSQKEYITHLFVLLSPSDSLAIQ